MPPPADNPLQDAGGSSPPSDTNNSAPPKSGKGKKKNKAAKKKYEAKTRWAEAEEHYGKGGSVSPSPPQEGVNVGVEVGGAGPTPPLSEAEMLGDEDMGPERGWEEPEPLMRMEEEGYKEESAWGEPKQPAAPLGLDDFGGEDFAFDNFTPTLGRRVSGQADEMAEPEPEPQTEAAPLTAARSPPKRTSAPPAPSLKSPRPQRVEPAPPVAPEQLPPEIPHYQTSTETKREPESTPTTAKSLPDRPRQRSRSNAQQQFAARYRANSFVEPANPPHLAQNHFYGTPGLDIGMSTGRQEKGGGKPAGSEHYCCCFDSFANAGDVASAVRAKDVLLVGEEEGLQVYRVLSDKMEVVGRLEGLRGGVVGAKVLPAVGERDELSRMRPLVALVVHGPMEKGAQEPGDKSDNDSISQYQTSVEVYSLQTQQHVSTLYRSLPVALPEAVLGQLATAPEPVGDLRLDAKGHFISISSGKSGEAFIYTSKRRENEREVDFRCVGKYWTSLQSRFDVEHKPAKDGAPFNEAPEPQTSPLLSLGSRWLALVPPSSGSKISVQGILALKEFHKQPPGAGQHTAPPQPAISCDKVGVNAEGVLAKYGRQAAQEVLKATRMGLEIGRTGWREFTQPSPPNRAQGHMRAESGETGFPPTNAPGDDPRRFAKDPAVISIIDLDRLLEAEEHGTKHLPAPLASFAVDDGCNFLSLSNDGLRLLTANRKGDASTVWDITHVAHGSPNRKPTEDGFAVFGPHITYLHRIPRNSQSVVLDVAWARDGHFVALLTANGTVHLHELSATPPSPKRCRRSTPVPPAEKASATVSVSQGLSPPSANSFLGSLKSSWQTMSTQVGGLRNYAPAQATAGSNAFAFPTSFAGFKEVTNAGAAASSRAVASGLRQGYSAAKVGVGDMWHADDNKIRPKRGAADNAGKAQPRAVAWLKRRSGLAVGVVCAGKVDVAPVQRVVRMRGESSFTGLKAEKGGRKEFPLPYIATHATARSNGCAEQGPHGFWSLRPPSSAGPARPAKRTQDAETDKARYETNPPFCPLYIDRRVSMLGYDDGAEDFLARGHGLDDEEHWLFGQALPGATKLNDRSGSSEASFAAADESHEDEADEGGLLGDEEVDSSGVREARMMESRMLVRPGSNEIRIQTRRAKSGKSRGKGGGQVKQDGEFDLLEDDEDGMF